MIEKLKTILQAEPFNIQTPIETTSEFETIPGWDSLKHLNFLMELQSQFNVEITPADVFEIKSINDVLNKLSQDVS